MTDSNLTTDGQDTTTELLVLAKAGHPTAVEMLYRHCLPSLRVWARGRLPRYARDRYETQDLVQDTLMHTLTRLDSFDLGRPGGLKAYLRRGILNRICDEIRRVMRRPESCELTECPDVAPSALELMIGREVVKRYEVAMARLSASDRAAITARLDDRRSYDDIAGLLGKPNGNAARMAISRAIDRLIAEMNNDGTKSSSITRRRTSQTASTKGRKRS